MENQGITSKQYFKTLQIICFAIMASQLIIAGVAYLKVKNSYEVIPTIPERKIIYILSAFIFILFIGSRMLYNNKLKKLNTHADFHKMLMEYRSASIIRFALLEAASFISSIIYMLSHELAFIGIALLLFGYFFTIIPSRIKAETELDLEFEDKKRLNSPDEIIL